MLTVQFFWDLKVVNLEEKLYQKKCIWKILIQILKENFLKVKKTLRIDLNSDKIKFNDTFKIRLGSLTGISSMSGVSINISLKSRLGQMLIRRLQLIVGFLLTLKTNLQKI